MLNEPSVFEYRQRLLGHFAAVNEALQRGLSNLAATSWLAQEPVTTAFHLLEAEKTLFYSQLRGIIAAADPGMDLDASPRLKSDHLETSGPSSGQAQPGLLAEWLALRQQELAWLRSLPPEGWNWLGDHRRWGKRTLQWWAEKSQHHAEEHVRLASEKHGLEIS